MTDGIWRDPPEDTYGYPGLWLSDDCVTGSINVKNTRLPLWAIVSTAVRKGWQEVEASWEPSKHNGYTADDFGHFLYCLLEMRGEFGRLLMQLAAAEHRTQKHNHLRDDRSWWEMPAVRRDVLKQLKRCVDVLEAVEPKKPYSHLRRVKPGLWRYDFGAAEKAAR